MPSEFGEDTFLLANYFDYFQRPRYYVDCGCAHPELGSNTHFLRMLGWSGLHIDGDMDWAPHWGPHFIHAVIHTEPRVRFTEVEGDHVLSRVEPGEPNVETRRLDEILFEHRVDKIGFLSIDVEGQETTVLKSMSLFPAHLWPPFIVSEFHTAGIGKDYSTRDYLQDRGYRMVHETYANMIYYDENRRD